MTIGKFIRNDVVTAPADTSVLKLAQVMEEQDVGSVVIMSDDQPTGVVTDRDLVLDIIAQGADSETTLAQDVMSQDLFSVDADDGVFTVMNQMADVGVRRVPVTEGDTLVGVIALDDLVVLLANELGNLAAVIEAKTPPVIEPES
jgi:signal-transduction protein with cAMP-binding, CBS, and nucleotidyltransferase domain